MSTRSGYVLYGCGNQTPACSPATPYPLWQLLGVPLLLGCPLDPVRLPTAIVFGLEVVELLGCGDLSMVPVCLLKLDALRPSLPRPGSAPLRAGGLS